MIDTRSLRAEADKTRRVASLAPNRRKSALQDNAYYAEGNPERMSMWHAASKLTDPTEFLLAYADEMDERASVIEDYRAKQLEGIERQAAAMRQREVQILSHDADADHPCGPDCAGNPDFQYERQAGK